MASETESVPLLGGHEGRATSAASRLLQCLCNLELWGKAVDALTLVLLPVGFGSSAYLLATPSSCSLCKTVNGPALFKLGLQVLPMLLMFVGTLTSGLLTRDATTGAVSAAASFVQFLCGVVLCEWLSVCMLGGSPWMALTIGSLVVVAVVTVWVLRRRGPENEY
ncbi:hypothetical protein GQ55_5G415600 [Panicum hallii var. hallii]|uniref:Uncharacterized protein n=1 Tax=Panicum hallii var. hallii TaxID=1504633 RepID=A0A2T7DNU4_9POAL|nr:hypothetical protein GQ55_5G415600 [Panicum hallii var. hallii]